MANLGQAYIHLRPYEASETKIRSLGRFAKRTAIKAASEIYGGNVVVEIELEEGSLIVRATVIGGIFLGVYSTVADYKGFKESVVELCDDAREFAVDVCAPFVKKAGVPKEDIYRFERRLKAPGKLYKVSRRLEKLEKSVNELSPSAVRKELARARADLDAATTDLSAEEKAAIENKIRPRNLPSPRNWPDAEPPKVAIREDGEQTKLFDVQQPTEASHQKRRIVFKATAKVPPNKRKRSKRKRKPADSDLLALSERVGD